MATFPLKSLVFLRIIPLHVDLDFDTLHPCQVPQIGQIDPIFLIQFWTDIKLQIFDLIILSNQGRCETNFTVRFCLDQKSCLEDLRRSDLNLIQ